MSINELISYLRRIQASGNAEYVEFGRMYIYTADGTKVAVIR